MADTQRADFQADPNPQGTSSPELSSTDADNEPAAAAFGEPAPSAAPATETMAAVAAEAAVAPESEPPAAAEPTLEASTTVPALAGGDPGSSAGGGEGGEWDLLVQNLKQWWGSGELQSLWLQAKTPLTIALALISVLLVLRLYAGLLSAIGSLPLAPGLLELVGLIWALRFGLPKMIRRSEREQLLAGLQRRWQSFSGRS